MDNHPMTTASAPLPTRRADLLARLAQPHHYDLAVIGGGATGLGVALDAAARWCDDIDNHATLSETLSSAKYIGAPVEILRQVLAGRCTGLTLPDRQKLPDLRDAQPAPRGAQ